MLGQIKCGTGADPLPQLQQRDCPACGSPSHTEPSPANTSMNSFAVVDCRMLFTHTVQTIEGKILHYDKLALERTDTTSILSPAHYGLANQIKSVGLYERVCNSSSRTIPQGDINFVDVGCAGGLFLLAAQSIDGYHCGVSPRFNVRGISIDPRERSESERNVGCPGRLSRRGCSVVGQLGRCGHADECAGARERSF